MSIDRALELLGPLHPLYFILPLIWGTFLISLVLPVNRLGLVPRTTRGLTGVVFMPFLHEDLKHLISNSVPLAVLLLLLFNSSTDASITVLLIQCSGGAMLWLIGRRALHIGASLLVFGLTGFHILNGVLEGRLLSIGIALLVAALYGSIFLSSINPWRKGSSWDGHLCGFLAGAGVAFLFNNHVRILS